jgi:outer membrane usher protein
VGQGSVAVVKVDGIEGVPVMRSNQVVAVTDARGLAFVPGLLPWQKNLIEIDPVDLPLDVEVIASTSQEVTPYARSGVVVDFAVKRTRQALLVLRQRDGTPVPVGTRVRLLPTGPEFVAGHRGEVWLTGLAEKQQRVQVSWPAGGCALELAVPVSPDGAPAKIGPLACHEGTI